VGPKISLLINSRIEGNANHGLKNLLDDLATKCVDPKNFEVLIKFDDDDQGFSEEEIWLRDWPDKDKFLVKFIVTPRRRGYADLHCGYADLMPFVSDSSKIIGAVADDMRVVNPGWDKVLIDTALDRRMFIIHPHKPNESVNIDMLEVTNHDESPFWSKQLIYVCQCNWWIYATDAWTTALEYWLNKHGTNITLLTCAGMFQRKFNGDIDSMANKERWKVRSEMFKFTTTDFFKDMVRIQALNIIHNN